MRSMRLVWIEAVERLVRSAGEGDLIMTLGAGSVSQAGVVVLERLGLT